MAVMDVTAESLSAQFAQPVPDIYVVIAKHSIMDMDSAMIAEVLGVPVGEVREIEAEPLYQQIRLAIAAEHARSIQNTDATWDGLEELALTKLMERMRFERDADFLLKTATLANRAQRRIVNDRSRMLDPSKGGASVKLSLSQRIVQKLQDANGNTREVETQLAAQVSVVNGNHRTPTFETIDEILGVSGRAPTNTRPAAIVEGKSQRLAEPEVTLDALKALQAEKRVNAGKVHSDGLTLRERLLKGRGLKS